MSEEVVVSDPWRTSGPYHDRDLLWLITVVCRGFAAHRAPVVLVSVIWFREDGSSYEMNVCGTTPS